MMRLVWASRRASARAATWEPAVLAAVVCIAVVDLSMRMGGGEGVAIRRLQMGTVMIAAFTAFVVDDPAESTLAASPTPLRARRLHRVVLVLPSLSAAWAVAAARAGLLGDMWAPVGRLFALEGLMYSAVAVAVTGAVIRLGHSGPAAMAGTCVVLALSFVAVAIPPPWSPVPSSPLAPGATARMLTLTALAALVAAWAARDPARPGALA